MEDFELEISIPCDDDGFVLLQCPKCGEYFKLKPQEYESEEVLAVYCPLCGLYSDSYLTEDVIKLAMVKAQNIVIDQLNTELKKIEKVSNKFVKFKSSNIQKDVETPLYSSIDALEIVDFDCCKKQAKIRYLLKFSGCHCPYCGGLKNEN